MILKRSFFVSMFLLLALLCHANDKDAIFVWVSGSSTCYQLSEQPKITYKDDYAILTIGNSTSPVLSLKLTNGASLEVVYGQYNPSSIDGVMNDNPSEVKRVGKYIQGGHLIIVKDGKLFDAAGIETK